MLESAGEVSASRRMLADTMDLSWEIGSKVMNGNILNSVGVYKYGIRACFELVGKLEQNTLWDINEQLFQKFNKNSIWNGNSSKILKQKTYRAKIN